MRRIGGSEENHGNHGGQDKDGAPGGIAYAPGMLERTAELRHRLGIDQPGSDEMADHRRDFPLHGGLGKDQQRNGEQEPGVQPEMPEEWVGGLSFHCLARHQRPY
jgi:hypothetical protein